MTVSRRRGTVIKVPDATPGLVSVDGIERSYSMTGVWKSCTAPVPNLAVDASVDEDGRVLELVPVDAEQRARERLQDARKRAKLALLELVRRVGFRS